MPRNNNTIMAIHIGHPRLDSHNKAALFPTIEALCLNIEVVI